MTPLLRLGLGGQIKCVWKLCCQGAWEFMFKQSKQVQRNTSCSNTPLLAPTRLWTNKILAVLATGSLICSHSARHTSCPRNLLHRLSLHPKGAKCDDKKETREPYSSDQILRCAHELLHLQALVDLLLSFGTESRCLSQSTLHHASPRYAVLAYIYIYTVYIYMCVCMYIYIIIYLQELVTPPNTSQPGSFN